MIKSIHKWSHNNHHNLEKCLFHVTESSSVTTWSPKSTLNRHLIAQHIASTKDNKMLSTFVIFFALLCHIGMSYEKIQHPYEINPINTKLEFKLEHLERLHSDDTPAASWLSILLSHIGSLVKRKQSQSYKFKELAKIFFFLILKQILHAAHHLKLLYKMCKYEMDPTSIVEDTVQTWFCPQTDRRTRWNQYTPFQLHWSGGYNEGNECSCCSTSKNFHCWITSGHCWAFFLGFWGIHSSNIISVQIIWQKITSTKDDKDHGHYEALIKTMCDIF